MLGPQNQNTLSMVLQAMASNGIKGCQDSKQGVFSEVSAISEALGILLFQGLVSLGFQKFRTVSRSFGGQRVFAALGLGIAEFWGWRFASLGLYLEHQGYLLSRFITPITHIITLVIPITNLVIFRV